MRSKLRAGFVATVTTALLTSSVGSAAADDLYADGDGLAPMGNTDLAVGTVCVGDLPASRSVPLVVRQQGNFGKPNDPHEIFRPGTEVRVSVQSVTPGLTAKVAEPGTITIPADWLSDRGNKTSDPVSSTVTVNAGPGAFTGAVTYAATGVNADTGATLTLTDTMNVTATVSETGACAAANTAPVVTVTGVDQDVYEFGAAPVPGCEWTDDHDGSGTVAPTITGPTGPRAEDGLGEVEVTCTKTDSGSLTGTASKTYTVADTLAPSIPELGDVTAAAADADGANVSYTVPDATDAVDGDVPLTCAPASGSRFPLGATTVTCSAGDLEGNTAERTFQVRVTDQDAPVVSVPEPMTLDATSPAGAVATFTATAEDNVDGPVDATCAPASGSTFEFGTTTVTCEASDAAGNKGSKSFSVTVQDVTAPVLTVPSLDAVEATGPEGAVVTWDAVTATDDVDGPVDTVACDAESGDVFPLGDTTVNCSAVDSKGNKGTNSFVVTVVDTKAPEITVPADFEVEATSSTGAVVDFAGKVSAWDLVDEDVPVDCSPASGEGFPLGQTVVTCTSEDSRGNAAEPATFTVTVVDTTPPALPELPDLAPVEATGPDGATVDYAVGAATDIVDGEVGLVCQPASGSVFGLGTTTVTCTATDRAGNTSTGSFDVVVEDTTAPVFDPVSVETAEATGPDGAKVEFDVTATDVVDPEPAIVCDPASGSTFPLGSTKVTCTATDDSKNSSEMSFMVNVADTTAPVVASPTNMTVEATSSDGATYEYVTPTAEDIVDGAVPAVCEPGSGSTFPLGETTVTCSATDRAGNTGQSSFVVTVVDTTAPELTKVPDITVPATSAAGAVVDFTAPTAYDLVDGDVPVTCTPESGSQFGLGTTTVECTATDAAGNTASTSFKVTVELSWSGLLPPVDQAGTRTFKQGSTIPVKFALTGPSAGITDLEARLYVRRVGSTTPADATPAVSTSKATSGNLFRYSADDRQYIFNLSTKALGAGTYQLVLDLRDGVTRTTTVTLK